MIILMIGIIAVIGLLNLWFYEHRVIKQSNDFDIFQAWVDKKLTKKYKC